MRKAFVFGDSVNTDLIVPGQYMSLSKPEDLAAVCMEGVDPSIAGRITPGDIFVAGANFGCGSSREHAPISIKAAGVSCVIAKGFARIFYRNAINIGLPALESREAAEGITEGDACSVDLAKGVIHNHTKGEEYAFKPFPAILQEIIRLGGMVEYVRRQ